MKKQLWTVVMAAVTAATFSFPSSARAATEEQCFRGGEHVDMDECATECCYHNCNGCAVDGHYICAGAGEA